MDALNVPQRYIPKYNETHQFGPFDYLYPDENITNKQISNDIQKMPKTAINFQNFSKSFPVLAFLAIFGISTRFGGENTV